MRICMIVELTGLPKCMSNELVSTHLARSLKAETDKLTAGNRKAKSSVKVDEVLDTLPAVAAPKKTRAPRRPKFGADSQSLGLQSNSQGCDGGAVHDLVSLVAKRDG